MNGTKYSEHDILKLRRSKAWNDNYDKYLRKEFRTEEEIKTRLTLWLEAWNDTRDDEGRPVMTDLTAKVTMEQMTKVRYILDTERSNKYTKVSAPKGATHQLPTWRTNRPESSLELFHMFLAHFANNGMCANYADALNLRGIAQYNRQQRQQYHVNKKKFQRETLTTPVWMEEHLLHNDHSLLHHLNQQAIAMGLKPPFPNAEVPKADNGEVFYQNTLPSNKNEINNNMEANKHVANALCA